ncbi:MAG: YdeI/OmpD-associated family protein [Ginsengibacter sp.]
MPEKNEIKFTTELLQIGNNTGICVPDEVVDNLGAGKKPKVKVTLNDFTYRSSIASMAGKFMLSVSSEIRNKTGVKGGDKLNVILLLDDEPREVTLPAEFENALNQNKKAKTFFEQLSFSNKQRFVLPITQTKSPETMQRRIQKAIEDLANGKK